MATSIGHGGTALPATTCWLSALARSRQGAGQNAQYHFWATKLPSGSPMDELALSQTSGERWRWRGKRLDTPQVALLRSLLENDTPILGPNLMYISPYRSRTYMHARC